MELKLTRDVYDVSGLAESISVSKESIHAAIKAGELPAYTRSTKPGSKYLINASDVRDWASTWKKV